MKSLSTIWLFVMLVMAVNVSAFTITGWDRPITLLSRCYSPDAVSNITALNGLLEGVFYDGDNLYQNTSETVAAGFLTTYNFTVTQFNSIQVKSYYKGGAGHIFYLEIYNYNKSAYEPIDQESDEAGFYYESYDIPNSNQYVKNNKTSVRYRHDSPGQAAHRYSIDYLALCFKVDYGNVMNIYQNITIGGSTTTIYNTTIYNITTQNITINNITINNITNNNITNIYYNNSRLIQGDGINLTTTGNITKINVSINLSDFLFISGKLNINWTGKFNPYTPHYNRTIQTFPASYFTDTDDGKGKNWDDISYNESNHEGVTSTAAKPIFIFDFTRGYMNETYSYWSNAWVCSGIPANNCYRTDLALAVPFKKISDNTFADITIKFKSSGGSAIGTGCPYTPSTPETFFNNITIGINRNYNGVTNTTSKTFTMNSTFYNWTTLTYEKINLRNILSPGTALADEYYAWVLVRQKTPTSIIPFTTCFMMDNIAIEQYS